MKKMPDNQIVFYQSPDGSVNIEVLFAEENIWLTQKKMAELFGATPQNITQHLKNIYAEDEADQTATCKDFLQVQDEGGRAIERKPNHGKSNCYWLWKIKERSELSGKMKSLKFYGCRFIIKKITR